MLSFLSRQRKREHGARPSVTYGQKSHAAAHFPAIRLEQSLVGHAWPGVFRLLMSCRHRMGRPDLSFQERIAKDAASAFSRRPPPHRLTACKPPRQQFLRSHRPISPRASTTTHYIFARSAPTASRRYRFSRCWAREAASPSDMMSSLATISLSSALL